jgi:CHAD domain-containing protein
VGSVAALDAHASKGPVLAAGDPVRLAARAVVQFHLRTLARVEAAARVGEVEGVHQLRVTTRRLRAALRLFGPALPARFADAAVREIGWLARTIGAVRDLDVLGAAIKARALRLDPELRSALGPLGLAIHEERTAALEALVRALDSARCQQLFDRLARFAESSAGHERDQPIGEQLPALLQPLLRGTLQVGRRVDVDSAPAQLHRFRVRIKRLRYALETLSFAGKPIRRAREELERLQDLFGAHQDAVSGMAWLWRYARKPGVDGLSLLPVGALVQALAKRGAKDRRRALKAWRKVERSGVLHELRVTRPALRATA